MSAKRAIGAPERRSVRRSGGFTLVEVMIAISALGVAVIGALSAQFICRDLARQSRETAIAMGDLEACMERALLVSPADLPVPGSEFQEGQPVAAFQGLHLSGESIVSTYPNWFGGPVPDPLEVVLTLTWDDFRRNRRSLELRTVVTR